MVTVGRQVRTRKLRVHLTESRKQLRLLPDNPPVARHALREGIFQNMKQVLDLRPDTPLSFSNYSMIFPIASFISALRLPYFIATCHSAVRPKISEHFSAP